MANELKFSATIEDNTEATLRAIQGRIDALKDVHIKIDLQSGGGNGDAAAQLKAINEQIKAQEQALKGLQDAYKGVTDAQKRLSEAQRGVSDSQSSISKWDKTISEYKAKAEEFYAIQEKYRKKFLEGLSTTDKLENSRFAPAVFDANGFKESLKEAYQVAKTEVPRIKELIKNSLNSEYTFTGGSKIVDETKQVIEDLKAQKKAAQSLYDTMKDIKPAAGSATWQLQGNTKAEIDAITSLLGLYKELYTIQKNFNKELSKKDVPNRDQDFYATDLRRRASQDLDVSKKQELQAQNELTAANDKFAAEVQANSNKNIEATEKEIAALKAQKAELEKGGTASTLKPQEISVTLNREGFDKQLQKLTEDITKYQQEHKIEIQGAMLGVGSNVAITIKLDDQKNVEEQLQAVKRFAEEWSQKTPVQIKTELVMPQNISQMSNETGSIIRESIKSITSEAGNVDEVLKQKIGTGDLTKQFLEAKDALNSFIQEYQKLLADEEKSQNLAQNTGKNMPIFSQLQSVQELMNTAKMSASEIDPQKMAAALDTLRSSLNGLNFEGVSSNMKTAVNSLRSTMNDMERLSGGVSPLENAAANAEASIAKAVIGIRQAVQEMIDALSKDNLSAFAERAKAAGSAIKELTEQINDFGGKVMVDQAGLSNFITGLGQLVNNLQKITGENIGNGARQTFNQYENDLEKVRKALSGLLADEEKLHAAMALGNKNENVTARLGTQLQAIEDYRNKLNGLLNTAYSDWSFDAVKQTLGNERAMLNGETSAVLQYSESMRVAQLEVNKLTELIAKYSEMLGQLQSRGMDAMGLDSFITKLKDNLGIFNTILNSQTTGGIEASKRADYTQLLNQAAMAGSDAAKAMKDYDSALAKVTTTVDQLKAAQTALDEAISYGKSKKADVSGLEQYRTEIMALLNTVSTAASPQDALNAIAGNPNLIKESANEIRNANAAIAENDRLMAQRSANQNAAEKEQDALNKKIQEMSDLLQRIKGIEGFDPALIQNLSNAGIKMESLSRQLGNIKSGADTDTKTSDLMGLASTVRTQKEAESAINAVTQAINAQSKAESDEAKNKQFAIDQSVKLDNQLQKIEADYQNLKERNGELASPVDLTKLDTAIQDLKSLKAVYDEIKGGNPNNLNAQAVSKLEENEKKATGAATQLHLALEAVNKQASLENKPAAISKVEQNAKEAGAEVGHLDTKIKQMNETANTAMKVGVDATTIANLRAAVAELENYRRQLAAIRDNGSIALTSSITSNPAYQQALNKAQDERKAVNDAITQAKAQNSNATEKLTEEEHRLANAINAANNAGKQQSQVLSDLQGLAWQYMSVYQAQQFVSEMAKITGELELQKKSLEVILGSASTASQMYSDVRALSQESPFSFMDLMKSTRQLSAFGIETKDLYGTMKALSDIGAGLNVDISRLILAYGHTRSYGYLSGIQNRQFENAGIDMIGGLAKKYNDLADAEKNAGRQAQYVTRKDIFSRMRAKEIPFEDVQDVIMQLDQPGGKFYNMQERQFDTLGGKLKNLQNNYNIMMSEIGQSTHGVLMSAVAAITDVHEHWQKYARVIWDVVAALSVMKVAQLAAGSAVMAANSQISKSALANQKAALQTTYLNGYNRWTGSNGKLLNGWGQMANNSAFLLGSTMKAPVASDAEVRALAQNQEINNFTKQRIALTGKLTQAQRVLLLTESGVNKAQAVTLASMNGLGRSIMSLRLGFMSAAVSAKAFMASMLTNPMTWIMVAVAGITQLAQKFSETKDAANEMVDSIKSNMKTDLNGLQEILDGYKNMYTTIADRGTNVNGKAINHEKVTLNPDALVGQNVDELISELEQKLQAQSPLYDQDLFDIMKFKDQAKQVEALLQKLKDIEFTKTIEEQDADAFGKAIEKTGSDWGHWFRGEGVTTNLSDYGVTRKEFEAMTIPDEMWNMMTEDGKKKVQDYVNTIGVTREQAVKQLLERGVSYNELFKSTAVGNNSDAAVDFEGLAEGMMDDLQTAIEDMQPLADETSDLIINSMLGDTQNQQNLINERLNQLFINAKVGDENTQQMLRAKFIEFIANALRGQGKNSDAEALTQANINNLVGAEMIRLVGNRVNSGTSKNDLPKIIEKSIQDAINIIKAKYPDIKEAYFQMGKRGTQAYNDAINAGMNAAAKKTFTQDWQYRALKIGLKPSLELDTDYSDFNDKQRKVLKEMKEKFTKNQKRIKWILGVDLQLDLSVKSIQNAIKVMKNMYTALGNANKQLYKGGITGNEYAQLEENRGKRETLKYQWQALESALPSAKYLESEHQSLVDDTKNKNKSNKGSQEDKLAKQFREETNLIKSAYDWYSKWEKEVSKEDAINKVKERFGDMLSKIGVDFTSIPNYKETLQTLLDKAQKAYNSGHKNSYMTEVIKNLKDEIETVNFNNFKDASDKAFSTVQRKLEDLTRQWEIFDKVREATGNKDFAMQVAGFNPDEFGNATNIADLQRKEIEDFIKETQGNLGELTLDTVSKLSKEQIEEQAKNAYTGNANAEQNIKSLIELLTKLKESQRKLEEERATAMANALTSGELYIDKLKKINDEYQRQYELVHAMPASPERDRAENNLAVKRDADLMKNSYEYQRAMSDTFGQTEKEFKKFAETIQKSLVAQLEAGLISAEDYANEIEKINTQLSNIQQTHSNTTAFMQGGLSGLFQNMQAMGKNQTQQGAAMMQQGVSLINANSNGQGNFQNYMKGISMKNAGAAQMQGGQAMAAKGGSGASTVAILDAIINGINNNVQSLMKALNDLADELDYWGEEAGDSVRDSDFYGFMSAFSKSSQGATDGWNSLKNGDIMGTVDGVMRSITGWYTGAAQWHDDKLSRAIRDLQKDVKKIEDTLSQIDKRRERTLGYDTDSEYYNEDIKWYREQAVQKDAEWQAKYGKQTGAGTYVGVGAAAGAAAASVIPFVGTIAGAAAGAIVGGVVSLFRNNHKDENQSKAYDAMAEYYENLNNMGSNGYEQEYNLLLKEREDLMTQLNDEMSKKKKDDSAIQELEEQIAELDDQINNYKDDMMKELLGIDLKSYASTLTDALVTAWENGEDAAEAYGDAVRGLLQDVVKNALQLAVVEPALKQMQEDLESAYDISDPEGSANKMAEIMASYLGPTGAVTKGLEIVDDTLSITEEKLNEVGVTLYNIKDIAESVFSISVDDWASQLSDALTSAFYNGELAAESYGDTVKSIMQQVVTQMLTTQFIEPMMDQLEQQLYGWTDADGTVHKGAFDASNPKDSIANVTKLLSDYFGEGGNGNATITMANEFASAIEQVLEENGLTLKNTTSSSTTNAISSAATEETMGTVSGYLAAIRQDVSVQRVYVTRLVEEYASAYKDALTGGNTSLANIDANVMAIRQLFDDNGTLYRAITRMDNDIHAAAAGTGSLKVR